MQQNDTQNTLEFRFTFPPLMKTACEQYLLGFRVMLESLEAKADLELFSQSEKTLFIIKLENTSDEYVQKTKEAFEVYLKLPEEQSK